MIDAARITDGIEDVQQAVEFVRMNAARFHVDPNRIVLIGESAGAQLASMAALRGAPVKAVVAFYCPSDLAALVRRSGVLRGTAAKMTWGRVSDEDLRALSPILSVHPGMPPFLFIHGTRDHVVPYRQSEEMCEAIHDTGGRCDVVPVNGGLHGLPLWELLRQTAYKREMTDWLSQALR
jgi:acetyl esterase